MLLGATLTSLDDFVERRDILLSYHDYYVCACKACRYISLFAHRSYATGEKNRRCKWIKLSEEIINYKAGLKRRR